MNDSDRLFVLVVIIAVAWAFYEIGKRVGADREREAQELHRRAELETDPEKKRELLLQWNDLAFSNKRIKKAFKEALLLGKKQKSNK